MIERPQCRNCNAPLAGRYCSQCGQRESGGELRLSAVAGDILEELISWDSRLWRTLLPLLFRPGFLTAEFIAGRRARYVPPFRLYLIISFVLFLALSLSAGRADFIHVEIETPESPGSSAELAHPQMNSAGDGDMAAGHDIVHADANLSPWLKDIKRRVETNLGKISGDPDSLVDMLMEHLPQMMFLLLPIFALLLRVCYLFSPFYYLEHLVFSLHFHSFAYLLYLLGMLVDTWVYEKGVGLPLFCAFVLYLLLALMRTYGSSLGGAAGKAILILVADSAMLLLTFGLFVLVSLTLM